MVYIDVDNPHSAFEYCSMTSKPDVHELLYNSTVDNEWAGEDSGSVGGICKE
jgi:hypothetical protein